MLDRFRAPRPATVIACMALFFAIAGGSAIALQGRNTVDSGDIKAKNVKTSDLANNAVTTRKIKANGVRTGDIQNGGVRKADLAPDEPYRKVGGAGNPAFSNGGEGDCVWSNVVAPPFRANPGAFYKEKSGRVHLTGYISSANGPGGDAACGSAAPDDDVEDRVAFILPEAYRPQNDEIRLQGTDTFIIIGSTPLVAPTATVPAGAVFDLSGTGFLLLDDISYRAAGPNTGLPRRSTSARGDILGALEELGG